MQKARVGLLGCGTISDIYLENLTQVFQNVEVLACADLIRDNAAAKAEKYGIPLVLSPEELLGCETVDLILNLTTPHVHYETCKAALLANKHVYVEKPLSLSFHEGAELANIAREKELFLGGAPDTFMGAGIQTCRKLIDDGVIGRPIGATAFMLCHGFESWHPNPAFFYQPGCGPLFDMGAYYVTALVALLGSIEEVCAFSGRGFETRTITSRPRFGTTVPVEVDTHVSGILRFENAATATLITSFDVWETQLPCMEIYGTHGTIAVPDPNWFDGPVRLATTDGRGFKELPLTHGYCEDSRGLGLADMADCILNGGKPRAGCDLTLHVLEAMCAIRQSSAEHRFYSMTTSTARPEPMALGLRRGLLK